MKVGKRTRALLTTASGRIGFVGLVVLLFLALFAPLIWGDTADQIDTASMLQGPSREHLAGTDGLGRDVFARVLVATRSVDLVRRADDGVRIGARDHARCAPVGDEPAVRPHRDRADQHARRLSRLDPRPVRRRRLRRRGDGCRRRPRRGRSAGARQADQHARLVGGGNRLRRCCPSARRASPSAAPRGTSCRTSPSRSCST